ncbi:MAG TPA: PEGA domain-containing protein, partial [Terriglobales bacterium]|nr:PEGA domain-containing protein [Terriglobales bacterium]
GVPDKPVITPKPMAAPVAGCAEPSAYGAPAKPEFQSMLEQPAQKPWSSWEPAVVRVKPAEKPLEMRPAAQVPPAKAQPGTTKSDPTKKAAMLVAGVAALLLIMALIALWNTKNAAPSVVTPQPTPAAEETVPSAAPAPGTAVRANPTRPARAKTVAAAPGPTAPAAPTTGELMISVEPAGALVQVDDAAPATGPLSKPDVAAGTHTVIFSKPGYVTESRKIDVTAGGKALIAITLQPRGAFVSVASQPAGATIVVDGRESGLTPARLVLSEGQHNITVRKDGYLPQSAIPTLARGQEFKYAPELLAAGTTAEIKTVGKFKKMFGANGQEMGMVEVKSNPKGATVLVNGNAVPKPTPVTFMLNPGNYEIQVQMTGYRIAKRVITLEKGGQVKVEEELKN